MYHFQNRFSPNSSNLRSVQNAVPVSRKIGLKILILSLVSSEWSDRVTFVICNYSIINFCFMIKKIAPADIKAFH